VDVDPASSAGDDLMPPGPDEDRTEHRILEGALRTLGRHGTEQLRMNAVSSAAGVSRGTLYRYFPTKNALFAALVEYERARFADALRTALAGADGDRVDVVLDFVLEYLREHPALERLLYDEPGFVLTYLRQHLAFLRSTTGLVLGEAVEESDLVRHGGLEPEDVYEVVLRLLLANFLVPAEDPEILNRTVRAMLLSSDTGARR